MVCRLMIVLALGATEVLLGQKRPEVRKVDFRNFTYPFSSTAESMEVPEQMQWMAMNVKTTVTLVNGEHDFNPDEPQGPSVHSVVLDQIQYGYLTGSPQLDAMVVLNYFTGGSANWQYVYAFSLASRHPKLLGWFQTGSRAYSGLYRLSIEPGQFVLDLLDSERRVGDCCSTGFVRKTFVWRNGKFVQAGPREFGDVDKLKSRSETHPPAGPPGPGTTSR